LPLAATELAELWFGFAHTHVAGEPLGPRARAADTFHRLVGFGDDLGGVAFDERLRREIP